MKLLTKTPVRVMLVVAIGVPLAILINSVVPAGDVLEPNYAARRPTTPLLVATGALAAGLGQVRLRSGWRPWLAAIAGFAVAAAVGALIGAVEGFVSGCVYFAAGEVMALTYLALKLRDVERRIALEEKARAAFLHGAEEHSRVTLGWPLT